MTFNYRTHLRLILSMALLLGFAQFGFTQNETVNSEPSAQVGPKAPESTELILPDIILDLEDPEVSIIGGLLPESSELRLRNEGGLLPEIGEFAIDTQTIGSLLSSTNIQLGQGEQAGVIPGSTVFIRGEVGSGLHQYLNGLVSIVKLGDNPNLNIDFIHTSRDGAFLGTTLIDAGTGYVEQETLFAADVGIDTPGFNLGVNGYIGGKQSGLQQKVPDGYAASLQTVGIASQIELPMLELLLLQAQVNYDLTRRFFSGSQTEQFANYDNSVWTVNSSVDLHLEQLEYRFGLSLGYRIGQYTQNHWINLLRAELDGFWQLDPVFRLSGKVGGLFDFGSGVSVPFRVGLDIQPSSSVQFGIHLGYRADAYNLSQALSRFPVTGVDLPDTDEIERNWFAQLSGMIIPIDEIEIQAELGFSYIEREIQLLPFVSPVYSLGTFTGFRLEPTISMNLRPINMLTFTLGYQGQLISSKSGLPAHKIMFNTDFRQATSQYGGILGVTVPVYSQVEMPIISVTGWLALGEVVELDLRIHDPLALALQDGRMRHSDLGNFIDSGFRIELTSSINL